MLLLLSCVLHVGVARATHRARVSAYCLQIKALSKLVALDLSYNACDLALLQELALADKPHLRTLDISFNQLCVLLLLLCVCVCVARH